MFSKKLFFTFSTVMTLFASTLAVPIPVWRTGEPNPFNIKTTRSHATVPSRIWIDTDAACNLGRRVDPDDCLAILALTNSKSIKIVGISTVFGNASLQETDATARRLIQIISEGTKKSIKIYRGAGEENHTTQETPASRHLIDALESNPLTIVALGPLTNIAAALSQDPEKAKSVERIVAVMGRTEGHLFHPSEANGRGSALGHGPIFSDLNFRLDPAAVEYLLRTGVPITLVPYEAARDLVINLSDIQSMAEASTAGQWVALGAKDWLQFWTTEIGLSGFYPFDFVGALHILRPSEFLCAEVSVTAESGWLPAWLWTLDNGGLFVSEEEAASSYKVTYCPDITTDLKLRGKELLWSFQ
jgi:purine nucleosidase